MSVRILHASGYQDVGSGLQRKLTDMVGRMRGSTTLRVGFLEGATYPDGKSVAMIAAIQEFGAPSRGIPSRPFFRNMIRDKSPGWPGEIATQLKSTNYDASATLNRMGAMIKGQIQDSIVNGGPYAPLAPSTVARKGFSQPLVHTGHMLNSVAWVVK